MRINSVATLNAALAKAGHSVHLSALMAEAVGKYGSISTSNFWKHRDFLRLNWSGAPGVLLNDDHVWTPVAGGNRDHFLHMSTDVPPKVAFTKNADKGSQDLQTRCDAAAYFAKYGNAGANRDVYVVSTPLAATVARADAIIDSCQGCTADAIIDSVNRALDVLQTLADSVA